MDDLSCSECGADVWVDDNGVAHHHGDGPTMIDHDADADHVPVPDREEAAVGGGLEDTVLADLAASLGDLDLDADACDAQDYTRWQDPDLVLEYGRVRELLIGRGEMLDPRTDEARELHSRRAAMLVVLKNRGIY